MNEQEEKKRAKLKAMQILVRVDKTESELRKALEKKEYSKEAIEEALEYVKSYGYVDDEKYLKRYLECYNERKSKRKIAQELEKKGLAREEIRQAFEEHGDRDEKEILRSYLKKKWNKEEKPNEKELRRIFGYLARQGFETQDIWCILHEENLT